MHFYFQLTLIFFCFFINQTIFASKLISKYKVIEDRKRGKVVLFLHEKKLNQQWLWKRFSKNDAKYEGEIKDGLPHGMGTINFEVGKWNGGKKYVGKWKHGKFHGKGKFSWNNGQEYEGEFKFGKKDGQGELTLSNGSKYIGEFKLGNYHGKGTLIFGKEKGEKHRNTEKYEGYWFNGKFNGIGSYTYNHGDKYVGIFKDNKKHGHGKYNWLSGKEYVGEFENDLIDGFGILSKPDGSLFIGEYKDGLQWEGILYKKKSSLKLKVIKGIKSKIK